MSNLSDTLVLLRRHNAFTRGRDPQLDEESADLEANRTLEIPSSPGAMERAIDEETIVMRRQRPVLAIKNNETELVFADAADSEIWRARLERAKPMLTKAIPAVGRIELTDSEFEWVGTGWLLTENTLVTNRHVANLFAMRRGEAFSFQLGLSGAPVAARIDFLQEIENPNVLRFKLVRPLHIEEEPGPDLAFFEVEVTGGNSALASPITLADRVTETPNIATIGYPAFDSRIPEPDLMERIYGRTYNKKRLAPGAVTQLEETLVLHNCTTLGGNSGSALVDLDTGEAIGLHFSGRFLKTNFAVRADVVKRLLDNLRRGGSRPVRQAPPVAPRPEARAQRRVAGATTTTITIPLNVTISVDVGQSGGPVGVPPSPPQQQLPPQEEDASLFMEEEGVASDYVHREGYKKTFLGDEFRVALPTVERDAGDVLQIETASGRGSELRYQHFSVVMCRSRRMCFFSAVNIDGGRSSKSRRGPWRFDPRLPKTQQIMKECYGNPPKFSRGHMTRREDPIWGDEWQAKLGNDDSMHVTNAVPQIQAFNSPIWLDLEDYALEHARQDSMRISVFTGPYFSDSDPELYGVLIPCAFWKVIAFVHDQTGKLCATGYEMSQEKNLPEEEEFVFGQLVSEHLNTAVQVPIRSIEKRSGLNFNGLAAVDPLASEDESFAGDAAPPVLRTLQQIRFLSR